MNEIVHKSFEVNGINMHVAELGHGPMVILFLHGFQELWYSWRHQMHHLSAKGYRTIAPDLRGYDGTDAPPSFASYKVLHVVGGLVALLDALGLEHLFLVGHDYGAIIAWWFCLFRPYRIKTLVNTSVIFQPRNPSVKTVEAFRQVLGDGLYVCRFQELGADGAMDRGVPVKFVVGDLDLAYHFAGVKGFIEGGGFKEFVPLLEEVVVLEGVGHFLNEEKPEEIRQHIYDFISKF